jgi:hypothetical protein
MLSKATTKRNPPVERDRDPPRLQGPNATRDEADRWWRWSREAGFEPPNGLFIYYQNELEQLQ